MVKSHLSKKDLQRIRELFYAGTSLHRERFSSNPYLKDHDIEAYINGITDRLLEAVVTKNPNWGGFDPSFNDQEVIDHLYRAARSWPRFSDEELPHFIKHLYTEIDGVRDLTDEAQDLIDDRWPITPMFVRCFEEYKKGHFASLEDAVEVVIDQIVSKRTTYLVSEEEMKELLSHYDNGEYKYCYIFSAAYSERILSTLEKHNKVEKFWRTIKDLSEELKGTEREPVLRGFFEAVNRHWGQVDFQGSIPEPTRHSLAHGMHADREVSRKDALQMFLILQGVPFWLSNANEIKAIELVDELSAD